jgi:hypothetical protein
LPHLPEAGVVPAGIRHVHRGEGRHRGEAAAGLGLTDLGVLGWENLEFPYPYIALIYIYMIHISICDIYIYIIYIYILKALYVRNNNQNILK